MTRNRRLAAVGSVRAVFLSCMLALGVVGAAEANSVGGPPMAADHELADRVLVEKRDRRMTLYRGGKAIRVYTISLGFAPNGDKWREGDGRTPEGSYTIDRKNPESAYWLSLGISYPTDEQRAVAEAEGRDPGGGIFIHGQPKWVPHTRSLADDWTEGCVAVSNAEIEEIWSLVPEGTPVDIRP